MGKSLLVKSCLGQGKIFACGKFPSHSKNLWLSKVSLMKKISFGKKQQVLDCVRFVFFIIFSFKFWGFCTVLLLIIKNIGNAPLIFKIISQCSFILFEHANFILLLLQSFSIYLCDKLLLQISVNYLCYKILRAFSPFESIYFNISIVGSYNEQRN